LAALHEFVDVAYLQQHAGLPVETVLLAVQEVIEEAQLKAAPIVRVEMRPVLDPVRLEPLLLTGCAHETLEIPARMQALAAPVGPERADDAAVRGHAAVPVGGALPHAHGGEVRRLEARQVPLIDGVVGDAVEPDLAVRPWLRAGSFDAVVEILCFARREMIDE